MLKPIKYIAPEEFAIEGLVIRLNRAAKTKGGKQYITLKVSVEEGKYAYVSIIDEGDFKVGDLVFAEGTISTKIVEYKGVEREQHTIYSTNGLRPIADLNLDVD